ncbi:MAG: penicillin-binding transpeptidase domain-containing protein, partial [Chloroflexi bacterium]|nr:penicillin-binding transpeptidase domain-containing protein [Chloroflexota bacterium]
MSISKRGCLCRRTFLPLLGATTASVMLAACRGTLVRGNPTSASPSTTVDPASTTQQRNADVASTTTSTTSSGTFQIPQGPPGLVAQTYLDAWNAGSYATMYQLVTPEAQQSITQQRFIRRYQDIATQATITHVQAVLDPEQRPQANQQHFTVVFDTILVGQIKQTNTLTLAVLKDGKTWRIQWLPSLIFTQLSGNNLIHMEPKGTPRGPIFDRHGAPLATLGPIATVYLKPADLQDVEGAVTTLADLLRLSPAAIRERFVQAQADVSIPLRNLTPAQLAPIRSSLRVIPGVYILEGPARVYPDGKTASQTIGYVSTVTSVDLKTLTAKGYRPGDIIGRLGIERWGEPYLAGQWGGTLAVVTPKFNPVTVIAQREPNKADSVHLTIDLALQQHCEGALSHHRGAIAVMNSADGSLLAVASAPRFNPNDFILGITPSAAYQLTTSPSKPLLNRPVAATYPPGQLFQPVTVAAALEKASYTPDVSFYCSGTYTNGGVEWHCWKPGGHGHINLEEAVAQTCDVAAYTMGAALNAQGAATLSQL